MSRNYSTNGRGLSVDFWRGRNQLFNYIDNWILVYTDSYLYSHPDIQIFIYPDISIDSYADSNTYRYTYIPI